MLDENDWLRNLPWRERLIHLMEPHFTEVELDEIASASAMDLLNSGELRTLVILFAKAGRNDE